MLKVTKCFLLHVCSAVLLRLSLIFGWKKQSLGCFKIIPKLVSEGEKIPSPEEDRTKIVFQINYTVDCWK